VVEIKKTKKRIYHRDTKKKSEKHGIGYHENSFLASFPPFFFVSAW
jgi:hypothetical protein